MKKLFVIGNGFDCAHQLPTSYDNFRMFLCDTYRGGRTENDGMPLIPSVTMGPKGEDICDIQEIVEFLVYIISMAEPEGDNWSELEDSLGRLDYDEAFDMLFDELDEDGDIDYGKELRNNEDMAFNLYVVVPYIKQLFAQWIGTIDISLAVKNMNFDKLKGFEDVFLTFNYTETLEELYGVDHEKVCHIHGKQGEEIFFGHGNDDDYTDEYMRKNIGSENYLTSLDDFLKKNTGLALRQHQNFFDSIDEDIQEIYSFGFSFGEVDLIYIKELCKKLSANAVWYLNDYDQEKFPVFKVKLEMCGFKGIISTYHV